MTLTYPIGGGFNRSMRHLFSKYVEEDVKSETKIKNILHRRTKIIDVGSLAKRRDAGFYCEIV